MTQTPQQWTILRQTVADETRARRAAAIARFDRDEAIRDLMRSGANVATLVAATGLTRARLYQIGQAHCGEYGG